MLIFQANDKVPLNESLLKEWDSYLTEKCKNDEAVLLPRFIDFVCMVTDNGLFEPANTDDLIIFGDNDINDDIQGTYDDS